MLLEKDDFYMIYVPFGKLTMFDDPGATPFNRGGHRPEESNAMCGSRYALTGRKRPWKKQYGDGTSLE